MWRFCNMLRPRWKWLCTLYISFSYLSEREGQGGEAASEPLIFYKVMRLTVFNAHVQHSLINCLLSRNLDPKMEIYVSQSTDFKHHFCKPPVSHSSVLCISPLQDSGHLLQTPASESDTNVWLSFKETPDLLDHLRIDDLIKKTPGMLQRDCKRCPGQHSDNACRCWG